MEKRGKTYLGIVLVWIFIIFLSNIYLVHSEESSFTVTQTCLDQCATKDQKPFSDGEKCDHASLAYNCHFIAIGDGNTAKLYIDYLSEMRDKAGYLLFGELPEVDPKKVAGTILGFDNTAKTTKDDDELYWPLDIPTRKYNRVWFSSPTDAQFKRQLNHVASHDVIQAYYPALTKPLAAWADEGISISLSMTDKDKELILNELQKIKTNPNSLNLDRILYGGVVASDHQFYAVSCSLVTFIIYLNNGDTKSIFDFVDRSRIGLGLKKFDFNKGLDNKVFRNNGIYDTNTLKQKWIEWLGKTNYALADGYFDFSKSKPPKRTYPQCENKCSPKIDDPRLYIQSENICVRDFTYDFVRAAYDPIKKELYGDTQMDFPIAMITANLIDDTPLNKLNDEDKYKYQTVDFSSVGIKRFSSWVVSKDIESMREKLLYVLARTGIQNLGLIEFAQAGIAASYFYGDTRILMNFILQQGILRKDFDSVFYRFPNIGSEQIGMNRINIDGVGYDNPIKELAIANSLVNFLLTKVENPAQLKVFGDKIQVMLLNIYVLNNQINDNDKKRTELINDLKSRPNLVGGIDQYIKPYNDKEIELKKSLQTNIDKISQILQNNYGIKSVDDLYNQYSAWLKQGPDVFSKNRFYGNIIIPDNPYNCDGKTTGSVITKFPEKCTVYVFDISGGNQVMDSFKEDHPPEKYPGINYASITLENAKKLTTVDFKQKTSFIIIVDDKEKASNALIDPNMIDKSMKELLKKCKSISTSSTQTQDQPFYCSIPIINSIAGCSPTVTPSSTTSSSSSTSTLCQMPANCAEKTEKKGYSAMSIGKDFTVLSGKLETQEAIQKLGDDLVKSADDFKQSFCKSVFGQDLQFDKVHIITASIGENEEDDGLTWPDLLDENKKYSTHKWVYAKDEETLKTTLKHEVTHTILDNYAYKWLVNNNKILSYTSYPHILDKTKIGGYFFTSTYYLPGFISEGFATMQDDQKRLAMRNNELFKIASGNKPLDLSLMDKKVISNDATGDYALSSVIVEYLLSISNNNFKNVIDFGLAGSSGHDWNNQLQNYYGINLEAFKNGLLRYIKNKYNIAVNVDPSVKPLIEKEASECDKYQLCILQQQLTSATTNPSSTSDSTTPPSSTSSTQTPNQPFYCSIPIINLISSCNTPSSSTSGSGSTCENCYSKCTLVEKTVSPGSVSANTESGSLGTLGVFNQINGVSPNDFSSGGGPSQKTPPYPDPGPYVPSVKLVPVPEYTGPTFTNPPPTPVKPAEYQQPVNPPKQVVQPVQCGCNDQTRIEQVSKYLYRIYVRKGDTFNQGLLIKNFYAPNSVSIRVSKNDHKGDFTFTPKYPGLITIAPNMQSYIPFDVSVPMNSPHAAGTKLGFIQLFWDWAKVSPPPQGAIIQQGMSGATFEIYVLERCPRKKVGDPCSSLTDCGECMICSGIQAKLVLGIASPYNYQKNDLSPPIPYLGKGIYSVSIIGGICYLGQYGQRCITSDNKPGMCKIESSKDIKCVRECKHYTDCPKTFFGRVCGYDLGLTGKPANYVYYTSIDYTCDQGICMPHFTPGYRRGDNPHFSTDCNPPRNGGCVYQPSLIADDKLATFDGANGKHQTNAECGNDIFANMINK